ncbi:probable mitochondrial adenine nucleotide transporter BTL1 isoform X2 [Ricinus communis]|uniref:Mitochondrial deoxynucleotide carrier, putative n=1 Tax=Ricinus communis TaxID=3988 RepID=B9RHU3_RICCO|nr:probable mitochondrial adenine nucleotide transporter BTL1 isoform X2 [Ricinus communis]EEF48715.1 Mitochondrial deoxynucleotide carrier, putative [Ricinus communis]|eukprot:XP_002513312.1 probable mitochondrial adenine nucleotide transporter BTL1 isoform X2 [Ricinus communis]
MNIETESQKKNYGGVGVGVFGEVCGVTMMLPAKELDLMDKMDPPPPPPPPASPSPFQLRIQLPDPRIAIRDLIRTREVGEFLSGALAGAMTKAVLAPLETIRTRMVVGVGSKNISGSFLEIIEKQGWQGLWAGNAINMLRIIPTQAIELGTFECVKRTMTLAQEKWNETGCPRVQIGPVSLNFSLSWVSPVAVAGAAAGIVSTLVCHPLEVLKDRLTISPDTYPSLSIAISKIYSDGGIGAFYAGISPTLIGMLPYSTCYYFMYETMKKSYCETKKKKSLNRPEMLLVGALAGFTASTISFPLEVARKRLMVGALQGKCPPHMAAALSEVIREEGLLGLYRGWGASCLKVMPSSGITWMFYEAWKDILLVEKRLL